jgi:hypothetical protein
MGRASKQRFHEAVAFRDFPIRRIGAGSQFRQEAAHDGAQRRVPARRLHSRRVIDFLIHGNGNVLHATTVTVKLWLVKGDVAELLRT